MASLDFLAADILGDGTAGPVDLETEYMPPARALRAIGDISKRDSARARSMA